MTLDQLRIFVEVAEREHLTEAARVLNLSPSAVSAAIHILEDRYGVQLFDRVGRRIRLTWAGHVFMNEAKTTLTSAAATELMLAEMGGLKRGSLRLQASQTIASYWLPPLLIQFQLTHPGIEIELTVGNTQSVSQAVMDGMADLGFIEGQINESQLAIDIIGEDRLIVVVAAGHPWVDNRPLKPSDLCTTPWIIREAGSGTRSAFESALKNYDIDLSDLDIALTLPTNEAIRSAIESSCYACVMSEFAAKSYIDAGRLRQANFDLGPRFFYILRHKKRYRTKIALAMEAQMRIPEFSSDGKRVSRVE
ncbi:MAG TPA: LysR family transcriptional regulator [Burkholderiales bacterium]|nr:LysR family transcriptional regulator [Burkholderiales bacterium]